MNNNRTFKVKDGNQLLRVGRIILVTSIIRGKLLIAPDTGTQ